jgi:hypothetical protein
LNAVTFHRKSWAVLGALTLLGVSARSVRAAEVTRVVTALDEDDTFDFNLTAAWLHDARSAAINREYQGTGTGLQVDRDLKYAQTTDLLDLRTDFGILWDVGLHVDLPIILAQSNNLTFDQGVSASNSTFVRDGIYPAYNGASSTLFQSPTRSGLQYLGLGIQWAAFNQKRDDTKPTWTLGFDADLDIFKDMRFDPANPTGNTGVGLGYHQLIWSTWVSKRFRHFDPYFGASYMLPIRTNGSIYQDLGGGQTSVNPPAVCHGHHRRRADRLGESQRRPARHRRAAGPRRRALRRPRHQRAVGAALGPPGLHAHGGHGDRDVPPKPRRHHRRHGEPARGPLHRRD